MSEISLQNSGTKLCYFKPLNLWCFVTTIRNTWEITQKWEKINNCYKQEAEFSDTWNRAVEEQSHKVKGQTISGKWQWRDRRRQDIWNNTLLILGARCLGTCTLRKCIQLHIDQAFTTPDTQHHVSVSSSYMLFFFSFQSSDPNDSSKKSLVGKHGLGASPKLGCFHTVSKRN